MKEHIEVDLDFLDDTSANQEKPISKTSNGDENSNLPTPPKKKRSWKGFIGVGIVVVFFIWIFTSDNDSNTENIGNAYESGDDYILGDYRCSSAHYYKAGSLDPSEEDFEITAGGNALENESARIDQLEARINSSTVNGYSSQYEIDRYNALIDEYDALATAYNAKQPSYNRKVDAYNDKVNIYNNYLESNCSSIK